MLKPLLIATATLFSATFVSLNTAQVANAAIQSHPVQNVHQELIASSNKSSHISAQKQSDIKSIHKTLTQLYRGVNQYDVESMFQTFAPSHANYKPRLRRLFNQFEADRITMSVEIQKIELLSLSPNNATIKIDLARNYAANGRSFNTTETTTFDMAKYHGKWKISDISGVVLKSVDRPH
jgi:hypothetical protein